MSTGGATEKSLHMQYLKISVEFSLVADERSNLKGTLLRANVAQTTQHFHQCLKFLTGNVYQHLQRRREGGMERQG